MITYLKLRINVLKLNDSVIKFLKNFSRPTHLLQLEVQVKRKLVL